MKNKHLEKINWQFVWIVLALLGLGLVNLHSALNVWGEVGSLARLFWSQLLWIGLGLIFLILMTILEYRLWERLGRFFYIFTLIAIVVAIFFGKEVSGHKSWIAFGPINFQPSEFAKIALIMVLAKYFSENPTPEGYSLGGLLKPLGLALLPCLLILLQKDLGSALFFPLIFISMAWAARIKRKTILFFFIALLVGGVLGYQYGLSTYQKARIVTFLHPASDVRGTGYHLRQSKIAVGSGQMLGKGYQKGKINKLRYLPEKHTDFIFPVLAEEWGFFGSFFTLALFFSFLWFALNIAIKARERFGAFMAFGIVSLFFWQIVVNLGGVLGLMPLTGVTLPFLSYGGSSMVAVLIMVGLLLNIHRRRFMF